MTKKTLLFFSFFILSSICSLGQPQELNKSLRRFFADYEPKYQKIRPKPKFIRSVVSSRRQTIDIVVDKSFASQNFTPLSVDSIYIGIRQYLPKAYKGYKLKVITDNYAIDQLIPNRLAAVPDEERLWGNINYSGRPWVTNLSRPNNIQKGLQNRHLALWASHGRYFDWNKEVWKWQRPKLFCTTEDLFTPTIVVPYLIPMLENAGAIVFTPRERDWQKNEYIVDNDKHGGSSGYSEHAGHHKWLTIDTIMGFAAHGGTYLDGENPFRAGTARYTFTTANAASASIISYQPTFKQGGRHAVYVSYQTVSGSVDDALYTVWHRGHATRFRVNQRMGGGTWVYLGTFDFDEGCDSLNRVVLSNHSTTSGGIITADAVRFGGGMGNIERNGSISGLPRTLEAARYYAQWAGMPYSIYSSKYGQDDYSDDINTRSLMTNYLAGGSCYAPHNNGLKVPLELTLAIHSDAGYAKDGAGIIGTLAICTTNHNERQLSAGISRLASRDLADALLTNVTNDLEALCGTWNRRQLWDRNYSETRLPAIPSAILEVLSHQSFPDMRYGQDPHFKFTMARAIYKSLLKYVCQQHGQPYVVTPLAPSGLRTSIATDGMLTLSWDATPDTLEPTAVATSYIVYTSTEGSGYDNGILVRGKKQFAMQLIPDRLYRFKVAACNDGGTSFTSEEMCALYNPKAKGTVMIVDGFHRLSSPAIKNDSLCQGFDFDSDPGIPYGPTAGWVGKQLCFDREMMGGLDTDGLGWSDDSFTGMFLAGNSGTHIATHAQAIQTTGAYSIVSCSSKAVEQGTADITPYNVVDLILGLEHHDTVSLKPYKTFAPQMQMALRKYTARGGALLVSGAHVTSDISSSADSLFAEQILKCRHLGDNMSANNCITGMGTQMQYYRMPNENHYCATRPDNLLPVAPAFAALRYADGNDACVAYSGADYRSFTIGFPFECITDHDKRGAVMRGILQFLRP